MTIETNEEILRRRNAGGWCWSKDDPESTYPDAHELLADSHWPTPKTGVHEVQWAVLAGSTWAVVYYDKDGSLETKEFDSPAEAEAFAVTARMTPPDD
jgi:hypothetical protein